MYKQNIMISSFSSGEISKGLFGRADIDAYRHGAMILQNFDVMMTGGIKRRDGLRYVSTLTTEAKIIAFEYSSDELFMLVFGDNIIDVYRADDTKITTLASPYNIASLKNLRWVQKGRELYLTHPYIEPRILSYDNVFETWSLNKWQYAVNDDGFSCQPFARYFRTEGIAITPSALSGNIEITSSVDLFSGDDVGIRYLLNGGEVVVTSYVNAKKVCASVSVNLTSLNADYDWQEQCFSIKYGWPKSVAFHQNRLVIGGSKKFVNRLWFSKIGCYLNFDMGTALDDEAIEFDIFSDKINEILCVFSGRHLQVFTSDSEWMIKGNPLTPSNISVSQQTKIGSVADRYIAPKLVEGSTIFVARNKKEIREFFYGDLTENYSSEDLILLSSHLLSNPVLQDYNVKKRTLYVVQEDGTVAVLLINKNNGINAWSQYVTDGKIISLSVLVDKVYVVVKRGETFSLEVFDEDVSADMAKKFFFDEVETEIENLNHLEGKVVVVNADNYVYEMVVENGKIVLPHPAKNIVVGIPFTHLYCPLPVFNNWNFIPKAVRLLEVKLRLMDTMLLQIDTGSGLKNILPLYLNNSYKLDDARQIFNGDVSVKGFGFVKNYQIPLFKIQGKNPLPLKILNVLMQVEIIK